MKTKSLTKVKKDTWAIFSRLKRMEDCLRTTDSIDGGLCITCGEWKAFKSLHAGHFVHGGANANKFSERGVHAQCYRCNVSLKGNLLKYRREIIALYGEGADEELEREADATVKFTIEGLEELKAIYLNKIEELKGGA